MAQVKGIEKSIAAKKKEVSALICTCDSAPRQRDRSTQMTDKNILAAQPSNACGSTVLGIKQMPPLLTCE